MRLKFDAWYTEFGSVQIHDYVGVFVHAWPLLAVRTYRFNDAHDSVVWALALLGLSVSWRCTSD